jgi:SseB protein C-terminal domain
LLHSSSTSQIIFIGEQGGADERRLKEAISVLLDLNASVARAYLVLTKGDAAPSVMLGLVTHDRRESGPLALQMDRVFGALFNTETHLDVIFLDDDGDAKIRRTCTPFYHFTARYH